MFPSDPRGSPLSAANPNRAFRPVPFPRTEKMLICLRDDGDFVVGGGGVHVEPVQVGGGGEHDEPIQVVGGGGGLTLGV